jgi:hypothetical protein
MLTYFPKSLRQTDNDNKNRNKFKRILFYPRVNSNYHDKKLTPIDENSDKKN